MLFSPTTRCRRALAMLGTTLLVGAAACEPATGPSARGELDAAAVLADYGAMDGVFASETWAGLQALAGRSPLSASTAVLALRVVPGVASSAGGRAYLAGFLREVAEASRTGVVATGSPFARTIISPTHLGRTFVYDAARDDYVVDPTRTGAPSNGVRFILYAVDGSGHPIPAREIGSADLLDEGSSAGATIVLRLVVTKQGSTRIDYRTSVLPGNGTGRIEVSGFATDDDGTRLDFDIGVTGTDQGGKSLIDADFDLGVHARNFRIQGTVRGVEDGREGDGAISVTARHGATSFRVVVEGDGETLDGTIFLNDATFVTVSGDARNPTLRGASGQPVTEQELRVVRAVLHAVDDVFAMVEDLVRPVEQLLLLGWIL
ncbi:MAG: hypothetical protein ABI910_08625 [Gemmatimonadota bacterium]